MVAARNSIDASLWPDVKRVIILYGLLLATLVPLFFLPEIISVFGMAICGLIQALIIFAVCLRIPRFFNTQFRVDLRALQWLGIALPTTLILLGINGLYQELLKYFFGQGLINLEDPFKKLQYSIEFEILITAIMPAIWEEIAFRGVIQTCLTRVIGIHQAMMVGAFLFAILHCQFAMIPYFVFFGYTISLIRWQSGSLVPGMVLHFIHNASVVLFMR